MPLQIAQEKRGVVWHGSFFVYHSLALVNRELTLALLDNPEFAARFDIGIQHYEPPTFGADAEARFAPLAERLNALPAAPRVTLRHRWPPDFTRPEQGSLALIQPWEFGSLPQSWVSNIERTVDEVWVPSNYVRQTYLESGVPGEKVFVVPNGVNTARFHPHVAPYDFRKNPFTHHIKPDTYKFLFVGGTIGRKGIDLLLDAYDRAFNARDNVTLIIKDFGANSFYANQGAVALIRALQAKPGGANIVYLTDDLSEAEIAGLYAACDCLVHPYRGEGYGLPIAEAMACGKPTIVTGHGAALDFANEENSYLIPATVETFPERRIGDLATAGDPYWAKPDVAALSERMKHVVSHREEAQRIGTRAAADIFLNHTWGRAALIAAERLDALAERAEANLNAASFALPLGLGNLGFGSLQLPALSGGGAELNALGEMYEERKQAALEQTRQGAWQEAATALDACLMERPDDWDVVNALAVAQFRLNKPEESIALLKRGLAEAPNKRDFLHNLAYIQVEAGDAMEGLENALSALEFTQENEDIRGLVERAREGVLQKARKVLRRYADKDRAKGKRDPEYRALMERYQQAGARLESQSEAEVAPAFQGNRLSLCMIVKNEERFLRNCLESVKGVVDEIVIVDTGSTDGTLDIAREYGAKIVTHEWKDDFSEARNVSLAHATGNWALWLDADEEIAPESRDYFRQVMEHAPQDIGAYLIMFRNWLTTTSRTPDSEMAVHHACRLFRLEPGVQFEGRIHEQNLRSLQQLGYRYAKVEGLVIDHFGYAGEIMSLRNKHERFIRMLHREVEEGAGEFYYFHLFNLGNAYFTAGDMENAALWLSKAAEQPDTAEEYTVSLFIEWIAALHRLGRVQEGLEVYDRAHALGVQHAGIEFGRGYCLLHSKRYEEGEMAFREALTLGDAGIYAKTGDAGLSGYKARYGLALALVGQDRYADAIPVCETALSEQAGFVEARYLLTVCLQRTGRRADAIRELATILHQEPEHTLATSDLANLHFDAQDYAAALYHLRRMAQANPTDQEIMSKLAVCCESLHLLEEAKETYERLRLLTPMSAEICVNLGRVLAAGGETAEAIDCFNDAIQINPKYSNAYFNAGDLLYKLGYYANAAEVYLAGLELRPDFAQGFFVLGNCYYQTQDYRAAALAYQQVLIQEPNHAQAQSNLVLTQEILEQAA